MCVWVEMQGCSSQDTSSGQGVADIGRGKTCFKCEGTGHFANVCTVKKEDAKSNAVAAVEEKYESKVTKAKFLSVKAGPPVRVNAIKQRDEISRIGNLDWDKELKHWVRRKPRGMAQMRVDVKVLVAPNKWLQNYWVRGDCKSTR